MRFVECKGMLKVTEVEFLRRIRIEPLLLFSSTCYPAGAVGEERVIVMISGRGQEETWVVVGAVLMRCPGFEWWLWKFAVSSGSERRGLAI